MLQFVTVSYHPAPSPSTASFCRQKSAPEGRIFRGVVPVIPRYLCSLSFSAALCSIQGYFAVFLCGQRFHILLPLRRPERHCSCTRLLHLPTRFPAVSGLFSCLSRLTVLCFVSETHCTPLGFGHKMFSVPFCRRGIPDHIFRSDICRNPHPAERLRIPHLCCNFKKALRNRRSMLCSSFIPLTLPG